MKTRVCHYSLAWTALIVASSFGCASAPLASSEDGTGAEAGISQHLISREKGLAMVGQFARSSRVQLAQARSAKPLATPLGLETHYDATAVTAVLQQPGAAQAFMSLGRNADGSTTIVLRVMDGTRRLLPEALANGRRVLAADANALLIHLETKDDDDDARALVTTNDGTVIRGWKYDARAFLQVAQQSGAASVRFALGQNAESEPTVVMFAEDQQAHSLNLAGDTGVPSPPY